MSAWAKPGVKCVCIDNAGWTDTLSTGRVYTVAGFDGTWIAIAETTNGRGGPGQWRPRRFRPLVTKTQEQDVAKFRHLLTPSPIDAGLVPAGVELVE